MDMTTIGGVAAIGLIAAVWSQVKVVFDTLRSFILVTRTVSLHNRDIFFACVKYLKENTYIPRIGSRTYIVASLQGKSGAWREVLGENIMHGSFLAMHKRIIPLFCQVNVGYPQKLSITYIRGTYGFIKFLIDRFKDGEDNVENHIGARWRIENVWGNIDVIMKSTNHKNENKASDAATGASDDGGMSTLGSDYAYYHYGFTDMVHCQNTDDVGFVDHTELMKTTSVTRYQTSEEKELLKNVRFWLENRKWYRSRGIAWKRGAILHGGPGTGKSTAVWCVSRALDLPVEVYHLDTFTNRDIYERWTSCNQGMIILLEDFDAVFDKRRNVVKVDPTLGATQLTFDALLNVIDGVSRCDGVFLIITTNHPEKLDAALALYEDNQVKITRPGRIDLALEFKAIGRAGVQFIAENILSDWGVADREDFLNRQTYPMTAAAAQDTCVKAAIVRKWGRVAKISEIVIESVGQGVPACVG